MAHSISEASSAARERGFATALTLTSGTSMRTLRSSSAGIVRALSSAQRAQLRERDGVEGARGDRVPHAEPAEPRA